MCRDAVVAFPHNSSLGLMLEFLVKQADKQSGG